MHTEPELGVNDEFLEDCFPRLYFNKYLSLMSLVRISISFPLINI